MFSFVCAYMCIYIFPLKFGGIYVVFLCSFSNEVVVVGLILQNTLPKRKTNCYLWSSISAGDGRWREKTLVPTGDSPLVKTIIERL